MKKLMAILLACTLILSTAACGKKAEQNTDAGGNQLPQSGVLTPGDHNAEDNTTTNTGASAESVAPEQDPTKPVEDADTTAPPDTGKPDNTPEKDADNDIKVEINNDGTADKPEAVTPPDASGDDSFVIDFDALLEVSKK